VVTSAVVAATAQQRHRTVPDLPRVHLDIRPSLLPATTAKSSRREGGDILDYLGQSLAALRSDIQAVDAPANCKYVSTAIDGLRGRSARKPPKRTHGSHGLAADLMEAIS
jgi:hypothetical protein